MDFLSNSNASNQQHSNSEQFRTSNEEFLVPNALQLRLDTTKLLQDLDNFISGKLMMYQVGADGQMHAYEKDIGKPLANDLGRARLVLFVSALVTPAVVQGNWSSDFFRYKISEIRLTLAQDIMINLDRWGIELNEYDYIIDFICHQLSGFLSRLIENGERIALTPSFKTMETLNIRN